MNIVPLMLVNVAMMRILRRMMATAMVSTSDAWVKGSRLWWGWASVERAHRHCCYLSHITAYIHKRIYVLLVLNANIGKFIVFSGKLCLRGSACLQLNNRIGFINNCLVNMVQGLKNK